jgi:glycosyltransferase involved in cell wall biosynthesis
LRIAQIAPLAEAVPPPSYGGTERVVSYLTEELVRRGHEVTLFASGDSQTAGRLVACCPRALRLSPMAADSVAPHIAMLECVAREAPAFDILHFHIDYLHYPVTRRERWPNVTTLHGRLDLPELRPLYDEYGDMPVVSISDSQRQPLPQANWAGTVHHGLPADLYQYRAHPDRYLAFVGRVSIEKRVDRAVEIARRAGLPLKIAAKIDDADRMYFEREVAALFDLPFVEYLGEVGGAAKADLLAGAAALLFPIDWAEPFGLVMIEAMACGTPVVAWRAGSVPEVVTDGLTGFIVESLEEAAEAATRAAALDRAACRAEFERRFTVERMAADYLAIYERIASDATGARRRPARMPLGRAV